jgi:hypothetical protein
MLTNEQLNEMERVLSFNNVLPKKEARQLIAAYREVLNCTPHVVVDIQSTPGTPLTHDDVVVGQIGTATTGRSKNRRKKNETLDSEA